MTYIIVTPAVSLRTKIFKHLDKDARVDLLGWSPATSPVPVVPVTDRSLLPNYDCDKRLELIYKCSNMKLIITK